MRSIRIKFMRWRIRNLTGLFDKRIDPPSLYVVTRGDGLHWAGPYRFQGYTFTNNDRMIYKFNNKQSALATATGCGLCEKGHIATGGSIQITKLFTKR